MRRTTFLFLFLLFLSRVLPAQTLPPPAPPLPPPTGAVVTVSTVAELQAAAAALASGTTILIQPGTYRLTETLRIRNGVSNIALRGATGNRDDVVIFGNGMEVPGVNIGVKCENATDLLVADLSIGEFFHHPIQLQGEQGCDRVRVYNVRLFDAGEQFVKGTVDFGSPNGVDGGAVEYCLIEYTAIGPSHGYTNGVDIHNGEDWVIRRNLFRNIRVPAGAPQYLGPAVLMWSGSRGTICEENVFVECERAVAFGLGPQSGFAHGHEGGRICNNFIFRTISTHADAGVSLWDSPGTRVLHNTVVQNGTYPNAIEYRFPGTSGVVIQNNLTDGAIAARDGASASLADNFTAATAGMFADAAAGDLHLSLFAVEAIDQGAPLPDCPTDAEGDARPPGAGRDIGADELVVFGDVPASHPFFSFVLRLYRNGVSNGCGGGNFCPALPVTRAQLAVFLLRAKHGSSYVPPPASGAVFGDVPAGSFAAAWIERLAAEGITAGCGGGKFCPSEPVTRAQTAVLLLRARHGGDYVPPPATGLFADVPAASAYARWVERLVAEGISSGCGGGNFCPAAPSSRGQTAVFLTKAFALP